jgi:outer membrane cobalamin receptor
MCLLINFNRKISILCPDFEPTVRNSVFRATRIFFLFLTACFLFAVVSFPVFSLEPPSDVSEAPNPSQKGEVAAKGQSELSLFEDIPVVVTASKKPERITEAPSIISVITEDDIKRMGARNIMDVLRTIPGMEIMKDAWNISQIAVRGLRSENSAGVKILIDGHSLNDPITGGATEFYDDLPLKNIRRIEIIRGPASALYGANAFVSVVNIITKSAQDINGTEVSLGAGSFHTLNPSLLFGKTLNELEVSLYADYYTTAGAEFFINSDMMSLYDDAHTSEGLPPISLAPGTFREERERLDLAYTLKYRDFTLHGGFLDKSWGPFLTDSYILNKNSTEDVRHIYADLEYRRFFTERLEVSGKIYADQFHIKTFEQVAPGLSILNTTNNTIFVYPNGLITKFHARSWRTGGEVQSNYRLFKNNDLTVGVACEYLAVDDVHIRTNEDNYTRGYPPDELHDLAELVPDVKTSSFQTFAAIFAQDKWKVRRNLDLTLGIRGDYFSDFGGVFTPKIGITYEPDPVLNIKALFGSAFRVPSFMESFMKRSAQGSPARSDLVVEELRTFEIGVGYKPVDWLVGEMNYFYTDINELTEVTEGEDTGSAPIGTTRIYQNVGGIDVQGIEVELRGKSEKEIALGIIPRIVSSSLRLNYSYQDTQDSVTHEKMPNMARHKGNIGIGLNLSAENPKEGGRNTLSIFRSFSDEFSLYFDLFLCGKRQRSHDDPRDALPGFALLDLTLTAHDVFHTGLGLSFSVKNLFDKDYQDPSPTLSIEDTYSTMPGDFPNPGRSFFLDLRYHF